MKISKIILLSAVLIILISVSGGIFAQAQTDVDKGLAGQNPGASSALDPNAPAAAQPATNANDPDVVAPRAAGILPNAVMNFKFVAGVAFHPRNSTYTYAEGGSGGCIYQTAGDPYGIFLVDVHLPEGVIIDLLRVFYYDTSATDSYAWLTQYDGRSGIRDVAYVASAGTTGYGNRATSLVYGINNYTSPIVFNWRPNVLGSSMMLCGIRIRYWTNPALFYLPMVLKQ